MWLELLVELGVIGFESGSGHPRSRISDIISAQWKRLSFPLAPHPRSFATIIEAPARGP